MEQWIHFGAPATSLHNTSSPLGKNKQTGVMTLFLSLIKFFITDSNTFSLDTIVSLEAIVKLFKKLYV